jgi:SAM-dependent methyltransferase
MADPHFDLAPSPWVQRWMTLIRPGAAVLDVAAGAGRHARLLARMGFEVDAVDRDASLFADPPEHVNVLQADIEAGPWPYPAAAVAKCQTCIALPGAHRFARTWRRADLRDFARGNENSEALEPRLPAGTRRLLEAVRKPRAGRGGLVSDPRRRRTAPLRARNKVKLVKFRLSEAPKRPLFPIFRSLVAIVTDADGSLDLPRLKSLIDWHVEEGTDGIVIVGTTGESPTVDVEEHCKLIEAAVQYAAKRVPVVAGTGGNSTREAIALTQFARKAGANYALSVVPYYNKPTPGRPLSPLQGDRGIDRHPGDPVQRALAHHRRSGERHGRAPFAGEEHRRHQGSHRQRRARAGPDETRAQGLPRLQR